jgi:hypothetical protein
MIKKILLTSIMTLFLVSCGSGGSTQDRVMEVGESYSVSKGDVIVKASDSALVKIIHTDGKETSTVFLLEGNATITHPKES